MNDGTLSQEEIDALLNVSPDEESDNTEETTEDKNLDDVLSTIEKDTLGEIGNISFGSSATTLSTLLNQKVSITTPTITVTKNKALFDDFDDGFVGVEVNYTDGFSGRNIFMIKKIDAAIIADIMMGGDGTAPDEELTDIHLSAIQEVMNQMMGTAATSMSTMFNRKVDISPPLIKKQDADSEEPIIDEDPVVRVAFQLQVGDLIDSEIMQLVPINLARNLAALLLGEEEEETVEVETPKETKKEPSTTEQTRPIEKQRSESENQSFMGEQVSSQKPSVQEASFSPFEPVELSSKENRNLDMLLDIPLEVTVELGRTKRTINDILGLSSGSIIELDKLAGEPVDIFVNQKLIAMGEVVVIDENFGVRVSDIVSQKERLRNLN